jgi:hypothetical protein
MLRPSHHIALLLASLAAVPFTLAAEPGARPTTGAAASQPATTQQAKKDERESLEKNLGDLRTVGPLDLSEVINVQILQGRLVASSPLKTDGDEIRVKLKNAPDDICTVRVHNKTNTPGLQILQLLRYDFTDPSFVFVHSAVFAHPGQVQLVGAWQLLDGSRQVSVIDQYPSVDDQGNRVPGEISLRVQHINEETGKEEISVHVKSSDLAAMQREHPSEVNAYARPVLRAFHAESVLSVDPAVAWQVFAGEAPPDEKVMKQVEALLPKLDAAAFADREAAADQLKKLGQPGAIAMRRLDRGKLSAEQASQIDEVLATFGKVEDKQAESLGNQVGFLLDCMLSDDAKLRQIAYDRLLKVTGKPVAFDVNADPTARGQQADVLRKQLMKPAATQTRPTE